MFKNQILEFLCKNKKKKYSLSLIMANASRLMLNFIFSAPLKPIFFKNICHLSFFEFNRLIFKYKKHDRSRFHLSCRSSRPEHFSSSLSQNRALQSPVTRLFLFSLIRLPFTVSCWSHSPLPVVKEFRLFPGDVSQPVVSPIGFPLEALELGCNPSGQMSVYFI